MANLETLWRFREWHVPLLTLLAPMAVISSCRAEVPTVVTVTAPGILTDARKPQVAVGDNRDACITYGAGNVVYCSASGDGGATYSAPVKVADAGSLSLGMRRGPRVALAGKTVLVSAVYGQQGKGKDGELLA